MCECVNVIVGLIGIIERGELWNRKGAPRDRRGVPSALPTRTTEGSPCYGVGLADKDHRRITDLWIENQQLAILYDSRAQCTGFQEICNCHKEGTKWYAVGLADNPQIREKECVNA